MSAASRLATVLLAVAGASVAVPGGVLAHAEDAVPEPTSLLSGWHPDPVVLAAVGLAAAAYLVLVRRVDRAHPRSRVPRKRTAAWMAGLAVVLIALVSPVGGYATTLFSVHMVQHLLLTLIAAPLLLAAAPVTLLLRAAPADLRRRLLLPILHSRVVRLLAWPPLAWGAFTLVLWVSHFSPLFDAALESELAHQLEHALYLGTALMFWSPVVAADPLPRRLSHPVRLLYLGLAMPSQAFLGVALQSAPTPLYPHYATLERAWGPSALLDQRIAGVVMWAGGELLLVVPVLLLVAAWFKAEERRMAREDARLRRERGRA
jgi:cytochrome c oxidase assembly factor CtaG